MSKYRSTKSQQQRRRPTATAAAIPKKVAVVPSQMFPREGDLFIAGTFRRVARDKYKILQTESERVFEEALALGLIEFARNVGTAPGMPAYRVGAKKGEVLAEVDQTKK